MFPTAIAGSLPKPGWLAETQKLWPRWKLEGDALRQAKADATLLWIKAQEDAGLDIVGDGEQSRQHFVHGFLEQVEGIDFDHKVEMGIRADRYKAMVPQVTGPLRLKGRVHEFEAKLARAHTKRKLKFTMPGPMTIVDTVADQYYGDPTWWWVPGRLAMRWLLETVGFRIDVEFGEHHVRRVRFARRDPPMPKLPALSGFHLPAIRGLQQGCGVARGTGQGSAHPQREWWPVIRERCRQGRGQTRAPPRS